MPDGEIDLADAALQLARIAEPEADWQAARAHLSQLARDAAALATSVARDDLPARAGALAGLMAGRHGYLGDVENYDDLDNANLIRVTERKRGLPVALGVLWLHAARAAGWTAHGLNFPGHFLIGLEAAGVQVPLDVFAGGVALDGKTLRALVKRAGGRDAELQPDMLTPMRNRDVLLRLQGNIQSRLAMIGQRSAALACTEDMLRIAPEEAVLWREAAVMHQQLDQVGAALRCLERFLALVPNGAAAARARIAMGELRGRLN